MRQSFNKPRGDQHVMLIESYLSKRFLYYKKNDEPKECIIGIGNQSLGRLEIDQ